MRTFRQILTSAARFVGLLLAVSLLAFGLMEQSPYDPSRQGQESPDQAPALRDSIARANRHRLGLDRPSFYLSVIPADEPDTLYRISDPERVAACRTWLYRCGNWGSVQQWQSALAACRQAFFQQRDLVSDQWIVRLGALAQSTDPDEITAHLEEMRKLNPTPESNSVLHAWAVLKTGAGPAWTHFIPRIVWRGTDCRYHTWLAGCLRGDWGISYLNGQPVGDRIGNRLQHTAWLAAWAMLVIFLLGILAGTLAAARPAGRWDWLLLRLSAGLTALPPFWAGALLLDVFSNPDVCAHCYLPAFDPNTTGAARWFGLHWVLPLIAYSYGAWSRLAIMVRASVVEALQQDFVRTARAKGASGRRVLFRHALRNSLIPIVVAFGGGLPALIGGSVVIEQMFTIPGLAPEMLQAVSSADMPVVAVTVLLVGTATVAGYWLTDVLAKLADPRVQRRA